MIFKPCNIQGAWVIEPSSHADDRGHFARVFDRAVFAERGLDTALELLAVTQNHRRGTLRGMHFQKPPFAETKLVRVTRGSIFDVAIDLRPDSPTFLSWHGETLSAENAKQFYIPKGCAHGYLTLADDTELCYALSAPYSPESAGGVRFDDPAFGIQWPGEVTVIHPRDANYPLFQNTSAGTP